MSHSHSFDFSPVCLITGGSSGIGLAVARKFARAGYRIAICGRRKLLLESAAEQIALAQQDLIESQQTGNVGSAAQSQSLCLTQVIDLEDVEQAKQFAKNVLTHFGRIDVLVNNAGVAPLAPFESITAADFESTLNVNLRSLFYLTQIVWADWMHANKAESLADSVYGKTIVNISSLAAVGPFPQFSIYGASKAWLDLLTHALAGEGEEKRIRVCSVRPGAVETPLLRTLFPDFPAEQCASPASIAELVWACVTQPADFPSGKAFTLPGGAAD